MRIINAVLSVRILTVALLLIVAQPIPAHADHHVTVPRPAEAWDVSEWLNGPPTSVKALRGRVVIVDFFQLWCPGCNTFSIPLIKHWEQVFADEIATGNLSVVSIHTVFEGHDYQNPTRLKSFLKRKAIHHRVGIDRHKDGAFLPETMRAYRTRGTPEMAFIDKMGMVRFQQFGGFKVKPAEQLIRRMLAE